MKNLTIKKSKIIKNKLISKDTYLLKFCLKEKIFPTQFLMLDTYPKKFLLKPFTIADYDEKKSIVSIIYRVIGEGTKFLSGKKVGDEITFLGPFGNKEKFFDIEKILGNIQKNNYGIILLAGGSGVASIIYLYKWLAKKSDKIKIFYGERDKKYVVNLKNFGINNVVYTTDNGSFGKKGFVTEVFENFLVNKKIFGENNNSRKMFIMVCGHYLMLKTLQNKLQNYNNIICYAMLEEYMCCGVGVCRSCVVKIKNENLVAKSENTELEAQNLKMQEKNFYYKTVCKDGPMFKLSEVIF